MRSTVKGEKSWCVLDFDFQYTQPITMIVPQPSSFFFFFFRRILSIFYWEPCHVNWAAGEKCAEFQVLNPMNGSHFLFYHFILFWFKFRCPKILQRPVTSRPTCSFCRIFKGVKLLESDVRCVADRKTEMDELQISLSHFCLLWRVHKGLRVFFTFTRPPSWVENSRERLRSSAGLNEHNHCKNHQKTVSLQAW